MHRILLIDDDTQLATLLGQYFKQFSFELDSATLPSQGFALLDQSHYDLVILDITGDGWIRSVQNDTQGQ